jgi:hypothetical protein
MAGRPPGIAALALFSLAGCWGEPVVNRQDSSAEVSPRTIAQLEALIVRDGEAAAGELVELVVASPVDLPGGELDRLGRLLIERSDRAALLERLREQAVARPESPNLSAWLERLDAYERSIQRGVDLNGY